MALVTSRTSLSQGASTSESVAFTASSGANTTITGTGLPVVASGDFFEIRSHPIAGNNGLYIATGTPTTSSVSCTKVNGSDPTDDTAETVTWLGDTTTYKSIFFDTAGLGVYILEQGNVSTDGVTGQAIYSFMMQEWKDDDYLIANAPFPMLTIDSDAGKYIIGQDASGNNSGWNWVDNGTHSIQTRKLLRNAGWDEVNSDGDITARYVGVVTLGAFEDEANDTAYYQFGDDTTTDDTVDFTFAGPVNEAVKFYDLIGTLSGDTPSFDSTTTITRSTGSFITDGFKVGGQITIINSTSNDGTYELSIVTATSMTITTTWTAEAWGTTEVAVNNGNALTLRLRVRDADTYGKTFSQANLSSAGKTALSNYVFAFPLANGTDLKIEAADIGIDANSDGTADVSPYSGMSITYYATPQSKSGLVGGSFNFGIVIDGNDGTAQQIYEFVQWSLRSTGGFGTGDIDADADTAIGRAMDGLMRFVGDTLEVGSTDGGLTFPTNPDGGGSGVFIDNLNATSANDVVFFDNTGTQRAFPETIAVTLDFNSVLVSDTAAEYDLYYDRTIRTSVADFVLTDVSGNTGTITSTGANLPTNSEIVVGAYIRVDGLTGDDAAMNGTYQIDTITTAGEDWSVSRYDGADVVAVTTTTANIDQNCVDTPDAIIVHTNVIALGDSNITFTSPDTITSDGDPDFSVFTDGMKIEVVGSTSNDGIYTVDGNSTSTDITLIEQTISSESTQDPDITQVVSGLTSSDDFTFSYDFDGNTQGGRTVSTTTYVRAKAIGTTTAQYTTSTVQTIASGTPLTIPIVAQTERNYV